MYTQFIALLDSTKEENKINEISGKESTEIKLRCPTAECDHESLKGEGAKTCNRQ